MARYNDNSSLGWKILSLFLTLILIAGVITGVVFWQKGNIQFIPVGQEQTDEQPDNEEQPNEDSGKPATGENGEELPADQTIPMPMAMAFRSAAALDGESAAYDSVTLTATVKPNDATNKAVDWSIAFVNPSSEWATGKTVTDYVTVTPQSDGSTTATVQCLQPFGEQIKVVVTSRSNTKAKAECSVDFVKRAIGLSINFVSAANNVTANSSSPEVVIPSNFSNLHNGGVTIEETAGTITDEFSYNVKIKGNDDTASAFNSQSGGAIISAKEFAFTSDITLTSEYLFMRSQDVTYYVEYGGERFFGGTSGGVVDCVGGNTYDFSVKSLTGGEIDFSVKVMASGEKTVRFSFGDELHTLYNGNAELDDYSEAFGLEKRTDGFSLTLPDGYTVEQAIETKYGGDVVLQDEVSEDYSYFTLFITVGKSSVAMQVIFHELTVTLIPPQIIF